MQNLNHQNIIISSDSAQILTKICFFEDLLQNLIVTIDSMIFKIINHEFCNNNLAFIFKTSLLLNLNSQ